MSDRNTNYYVYGVVESSDAFDFETEAVGGADRVYPISHRRLTALVSSIDVTEPEETDEDARRHDEVLREIMTRDGDRAVVPMRFGMVFENERALKNVLRGGRSAFRRALNDVEGRIELGLKVVREADVSVDDEAIVERVSEELEPLAESVVENGLFSDRLILNRSYLVDRDDREAFDEAIGRLEDELGDDVMLRYTGPFAPYSFTDVRIGAQR